MKQVLGKLFLSAMILGWILILPVQARTVLCGPLPSWGQWNKVLQAAEQGDSVAQCTVAMAYGLGHPAESKDVLKSAYWMQKSAEQGNIFAQEALAGKYLSGEGVPKDKMKATQWYQKVADQGNNHAQYMLALMSLEGDGVSLNFKAGCEALRVLGEKGYQDAIGSYKYFCIAEKPDKIVRGSESIQDILSDIRNIILMESIMNMN